MIWVSDSVDTDRCGGGDHEKLVCDGKWVRLNVGENQCEAIGPVPTARFDCAAGGPFELPVLPSIIGKQPIA